MLIGDVPELLNRFFFLGAVHGGADLGLAQGWEHRHDVQKMKSGTGVLRYALGEPQGERRGIVKLDDA